MKQRKLESLFVSNWAKQINADFANYLIKLPENFLTAEQYQEVLRANQRELLEAKKTCEQDLKIDYDRTTRKAADKSQNEQEQKLQDERNRNLEIQRMIEYDNHMKKMQIQQRNAEMNQAHSKTIFFRIIINLS